MSNSVDFSLLKNVITGIGLPVYHGNGCSYEGHEYPNVVILIKADSTGYFCHLCTGIAEPGTIRELDDGLKRAFESNGIDYRQNGAIVSGGHRALEYEIEIRL